MTTDRPARNDDLSGGVNHNLNGSAYGARARSRRQAGAPLNGAHGEPQNAERQAKHDAGEVESLSLEAALDELDRITAALEESHRPLEESLALYERGVRLVQHSQELLDSADLRLQRLRPASQDVDYNAHAGFALDDVELDEE